MITLFSSSATIFTTNGLGSLRDAVSCLVTEERNGQFELELTYPITGSHYPDLGLRCIIFAKPNPYSNPQPFRIYDISKPINGIVTVNAEHISYDTSGQPVSPFTASSITDAFDKIKMEVVTECPFTFETNMDTVGDLNVTKPTSIRALLGGDILNIYGGEYEFDGFHVKLHEARGITRKGSIRYGKNLTDLRQDENCNSVYTGVYPFWYSNNDGLVELSEKIVNAPGTYDFTKIYTLDLSGMWTEKPTEDQIRTEANNYIINNNIGIPKVSIEVSFIQLSQSEEYKNFAILETVMLCDYVTVEFPKLNVSATAKCIKTVYNVLTDRYESLELGEAKSNIAVTISNGSNVVNKKIDATNTRFSKEVDTIKIHLADIDTLMVDKVNVRDLEAGYAHIINGYLDMAQIEQASITDALIANLDAAKISGQLDTSKVDIVSPDGRMIIKDNSILTYDYINNDLLQPYLRVQVGRIFDIVNGELVPRTGNNAYGFEVRDADGQTIMIDGQGVHSAGITEGAVNNGHIAPNAAIDGAKLDIATVIESINNDGSTTINSSKVYIDGTTLDVKIGAIDSTQTDQGSTISMHDSEIKSLQDEIVLKVSQDDFNAVKDDLVYKLEIISSNGQIFKNGDISTTLEAKVYHGVDDVTNQFDSNRFRWTRTSNDSTSDAAWNNAYFGGTKQITITNDDIQVRATFSCQLLDVNLQ